MTESRKVIANEWMSLDGVIQSSGSDDDQTGGSAMGLAPAVLRREVRIRSGPLANPLVRSIFRNALSDLIRRESASSPHDGPSPREAAPSRIPSTGPRLRGMGGDGSLCNANRWSIAVGRTSAGWRVLNEYVGEAHW